MIFRRDFGNTGPSRIPKVFLRSTIFLFWFYYQGFDSIVEAIAREKYVKGKTRKWKEALVNSINPDWKDLTLEIALELKS